jgi:hypothetical protein
MSASHGPGEYAALREHVALVRALLEEVEHVVPAARATGDGEAIGRQLMEEMSRLGRRLLECAALMDQTPPIRTELRRQSLAQKGGR